MHNQFRMLENYTNQLLVRVRADMENFPNQDNQLKYYTHMASLYSEAVKDLNNVVVNHEFGNIEEEISFFKTTKPLLLSEQHYCFHRAQLLEKCHNLSKKGRDDVVKTRLHRIDAFFSIHQEFCTYYELDKAHKDKDYFVRLSSRSSVNLDYNLVDKDYRSTCEKGHTIGKILSKKKLSEYFQQVLHLDPLHNMTKALQAVGQLNFNGTQTEMVELIYALKACNLLNDSISRISEVLSHSFGFSAPDTYKIWQKIKERKMDQTRLLTKMQKAIKQQIRTEVES